MFATPNPHQTNTQCLFPSSKCVFPLAHHLKPLSLGCTTFPISATLVLSPPPLVVKRNKRHIIILSRTSITVITHAASLRSININTTSMASPRLEKTNPLNSCDVDSQSPSLCPRVLVQRHACILFLDFPAGGGLQNPRSNTPLP